MNGLLMAFAKWLESSSWAVYISGSDWAYPYVQWTHFAGLSLWLATSLAVDLRLLGVGRKRHSAAELSDSMFVWNWIGFAVALAGGFMLFASSATGFVPNPAFLIKIGILIPLALALHIFIQVKARAWSEAPDLPAVARLAGLLELLLWLAVVIAAVAIPNYETH